MSSPDWALQAALRAALLADAGVEAALGDPARIHDAVPPDPVFPYATLGPAQSRPLDGEGALEQTLELRVRSRYEGRREAEEAADAVRRALDGATLEGGGWRHSAIAVTSTDVLRAGDGRTWEAVVRLRAVSEPT